MIYGINAKLNTGAKRPDANAFCAGDCSEAKGVRYKILRNHAGDRRIFVGVFNFNFEVVNVVKIHLLI